MRKRQRLWIVGLMVVGLVGLVISAVLSARATLSHDRAVFRNRVSAARNYVEGTVTPVRMISGHFESSFVESGFSRRRVDLVTPPEFEPAKGMFELFVSEQRGSVFGLGDYADLPEATREEIINITAMNDLFENVLRDRPETAWLYYISLSKFSYIAPYFDVETAEQFHKFYTYPFWVDATPEHDPGGTIVVTDVYEDIGGKGSMITISDPIVVAGRFVGVMCMDVTLREIQRTLDFGDSRGRTSIIDEKGQVLTGSGGFADLSIGDMISDEDHHRYTRIGKDLIVAAEVFDGQLFAVHKVTLGALFLATVVGILPVLMVWLILVGLAVFAFKLRQSYARATGEVAFSHRLLSVIGHDLQTPLSVAAQSLDLIETENSAARDLLRTSLNSATTLLKDLTYWGKSRFEEVAFEAVHCSVDGVVSRCAAAVAPAAEAKRVDVQRDIRAAVVTADAEVLGTVLRNLLSNAVKFSPPEGTVTISAEAARAGFVAFRITDAGPGMRDDQIRAVMDRRPLLSERGTRGEKGSGIGLSIVTSLCDNAGWPLAMARGDVGGTVVTVSVPANE